MVRNTRGGNKHKKAKNNNNNSDNRVLKLKDKSPESDELYAIVLSKLGGAPARIKVICENGIEKQCVIRGKFFKKIWINANDIVLINYDKSKNNNTGEVIHKYTTTEVSRLHSLGHLNEYIFKKPEEIQEDDNVEFESVNNDFYTMHNNNSKNNSISIAELDDCNSDSDASVDFTNLKINGSSNSKQKSNENLDEYDSDSSIDIDAL